MITIKTANFAKLATDFNDQPNFTGRRYEKGLTQYLANDGSPDNAQDIERLWGNGKKKKNKKKRRRAKRTEN